MCMVVMVLRGEWEKKVKMLRIILISDIMEIQEKMVAMVQMQFIVII